MFGRMMNNYYYGKSGKRDFRKEDLPTTRKELFRQTLRTRFASLIRLNLLYALIWIPAMIVIYQLCNTTYSFINNMNMYSVSYSEYKNWAEKNEIEIISEPDFNQSKTDVAYITRDYDLYAQVNPGGSRESFITDAEGKPSYWDWMNQNIWFHLLYLIPCIAITGPFTAGISYVTRNWARDEHAFIWSDFKDAVKQNWKIPLVISLITGLLPFLAFEAWIFYGDMAKNNIIMTLPQIIVPMIGVLWSLCVIYMYPMTVTYQYRLKDVLVNGWKFGIGRLPFSIAIRLLHCIPVVIFIVAQLLFGLDMMLALILLGAYYCLIGFGLSRFITASYTNAVFDRYLNSRIEGAKVNQGLQKDEFDDDDDDDDDDISENDDGNTEAGRPEQPEAGKD